MQARTPQHHRSGAGVLAFPGSGYAGNFVGDVNINGTIYTGLTDGAYPQTGLVRDSAGNLYGTAVLSGGSGHGVVFKVNPTGQETVLITFTGGADGALPYGGLVRDSTGNFYGTTSAGGTFQWGNIFKLDTTGTETVLYSFTGGADGSCPMSGLIRDSAGNLYGTTQYGGSSGAGRCSS